MILIRINRTLISFATAFVCAVLLMTIRCFSYDYSKITGTTASGADISGYATAFQINVVDFGADPTGNKDSQPAIQKALDYAVDNASDSVQLKVYVPDGYYIINKVLKIYSNTWLYLDDGATIYRNFEAGRMLCNARQTTPGGYEGERNIIIEGGCLDGNTTGTVDYSNIRFAHITNLWIKDVDIRNNYNGHHLEIGGAKNVTIENCTFHGYRGSAEKEAIQLDVMNSSDVFIGYEPFDDTPCENVVIRNNNFYDLMRGLGSHSATVGVYYKNILIQGNTFENLTSTAMVLYNYKDCIVENNTMEDVGYGIDFSYMNENADSSFLVPVSGYSDISDRLNDNANTIIRNNAIYTSVTNYVSQPWAIRIKGRELKDDEMHPDYNYKVEGVKITDNTFRTVASAIILDDTKGILISTNTIVGKDDFLDNDLVSINNSTDCTVSSNTIKNGTQNSVYISGGSDNSVISNKLYFAGVSGVYISNASQNVTIEKNRVQKSVSNGIKITKNSTFALSENVCKACKKSGIFVQESSGTIKNNNIKENEWDGIYFKDSSVNCVGNTLTSNAKYGLSIDSTSVVTIDSNVFKKNGKNKMKISDGGQAQINSVSNFACDDVYDDNVQLSWNPVDEADGYIVYRKLSGSEDNYESVSQIQASSYVDTALASKTKYDYYVKAYFIYNDENMTGQESNVVTIRTKTSIADASSDMEKVVNFTGKKRTQSFNIYVDGVPLVKDVDYTVKYSNNLNAGTAYVTVTGKGEYCKAKIFTFEITFLSNDVTGIKQSQNYDKSPMLFSDNIDRVTYEFKAVSDEIIYNPSSEEKLSQNSYFDNQISQMNKYNGIKIQFRSVKNSSNISLKGTWL